MEAIEEVLTRSVANIIPGKKELIRLLTSGKKLNIYLGIDPTSTKIHLGHSVPLRKLNEFAKLGHNVTFLIGDFTALIGDTSDKESQRPALTLKEIEENFKTYKKQAEKILDFSRIKIKYNSQWLKKLSLEDIIKLTQHFSVGDFVGRELIKKRLDDKKRVGLHELLYPVMQGYDSYFMDTDLQIGGTDQTFNMQAGRTLIKDLKNKESFILTTPILEGTDGRKMSKSWGNTIWLDDNAVDMYRKIMAIPDEFILNYFLMATNLPTLEIRKYEERLIKKENPINVKKELAYEIVKQLHNQELANKAKREFERVVQKKDISTLDMTYFKGTLGLNIIDIIKKFKLASSTSEAKRLIREKAVRLDGKTVEINDTTISKVGRHILEVGNINKRKPIQIILDDK
jgi:tyrosyl-tRNA synthetase